MPLPKKKDDRKFWSEPHRRNFWAERLGYKLWCGCRFVIDDDGIGIHFTVTCDNCRPVLRPDLLLRPVMFP